MNSRKKLFKNFAGVVMSNLTTILSGVFIGFLVPKMLSIEDYGSYKTFTLYLSYVGLFSLGIIDGIVLKYGDKDYNQIESERFRSYFTWYFAIQLSFGIIISFISLILLKGTGRIIGMFVAVNMIVVNITGYFQQISQITQRFGEYSFRKILQSILNIVSIIILYILYSSGHEIGCNIYIFTVVIINLGLSLWYIKTYKDIIFGKHASNKVIKNEIGELIKCGFPLLFANLCSSLILTTDKQFVNLLFDRSTYAIYSFAYNMLSLVTVATSAIATVLYPVLMRTKKERLKETYDSLVACFLSFVFITLLIYFPLQPFVDWFLPKYISSLVIFNIIFPGLAISSCITVIMHNYYKVLGKNLLFFKKSVIILFFSCIFNAIAFYLFKSTSAISMASIITILIWYIYIENEFVKEYGYNRTKNLIYIIIAMCGFYTISNIFKWYLGFIVYFIFIILLTFFFNGDSIKKAIKLY